MNREYKEKLSHQIEKHYSDLEMRIMEDIVRRIQKAGKITSTAEYQISILSILGNSSEDIEKMIKEALDATYPEIFELYDQVIDWEYVRNKDLYEQINARYIPFEENDQLQQITNALIRQTNTDLQNITQSLGFYLDYGNGRRVLTPLAQVYQEYLDAACMDIVSGAFDYNSVLRRVVTQLTNSGLRQIDYASGHANRVDVAARRAVMTGITQLTGHISDFNADTLGTEYFEVAWHAGARPTHQVWQGKVWSKEQLVTVCGLGSVTGLEGINCYHERYPFFPGISERNWSDEWLEKKNREENTPKEFGGKRYTVYEAKQRQRQMETAMRAQREKVQLLQAGDADQDEVLIARAKYQGQLDEYSRFSRKMGLTQERERIYVDGRGRIALNSDQQKRIEARLETMYNKGSITANIKAYEADLRGLKKYQEKVTNAELFHYRLNKRLKQEKLIRGYVVPAEKRQAYILEDLSSRDPAHVMKRMSERNITDDQVQEYVNTALFAVLHYNDTRLAYYSTQGVTVLTKTEDYGDTEWIVKTVWSKSDFDENTDKILEVAREL
jgi:hypothetical protein|nr:MAG TPA: minor capsid protein [Caudoviricetes sp.]